MPAFSIVGDLLLKTGSFVTDTQRAERSLKSLRQQAQDTAAVFKGSFLGGLAAGAVTELVSQLAKIPSVLGDIVREAGNFQDIGERIGAAAEDVAGFQVALSTAGSNINELADFSVKLTKALSKIDEESEGAGKALAAIGIPLEEFKRLNPVEQIEALSKALGSFAAGPEQTAVLEGLVKGGSQLLPFLKELEQQGGRQNILTKEQIKLADDYADRQARSAAQLKLYAQIAATDALPAITALQNVFRDLVKELLNANSASNTLGSSHAIQDWAKEAALFIASFVDSLRVALADVRSFVATTNKEFAELSLLKAKANAGPEFIRNLIGVPEPAELTAALGARNKAVAEADAALIAKKGTDTNKVRDLVQKQFDAMRLTGERGNASTDPRSTTFGQPLKPRIDISGLATAGGAGGKDDPTKKLLDNQLKALDAIIRQEGDLLRRRNTATEDANKLGIISIQAYYDAQIAIIEAATSAQLSAIDKQIALVKSARDKATKATDRADAEGKLADLVEKRARIQEDADDKVIEAAKRKSESEKRYRDQIEATRATLLELQGDLAGAAAIRFDQQNFQLMKDALANGDQAAVALLKSLRQATIAQAEFSKAQADTQKITDQLANAEDRIAISRQLGATTELQSLKQLGDVRAKYVELLEKEVQAQEAIAKASGNPALIQNAERARIALEQLKAVADPLGDKFRGIFSDSAGNSLADFITGTKSAKEAFLDFANSVAQQITRLAANSISESVFGKGTGGGDLIGQFAGLFGGLFGGGKAGGGDVMPGRSYLVGENGPEAFVPRTAGTIVPSASRGGGGGTVVANINVGVQGQVDRRAREQIATDVARQLQVAQRNL